MGGFLSLYDETDRVDLGGGYYVDIKRYLSDAEADRASRALVAPQLKSEVVGAGDGTEGEVRSVTTTVDQGGYNTEVLVAAIVDWNLTDRGDDPLPLPPYVPAKPTGEDRANEVRRQSIRQLPAFATKKILKQISDNEKRGAGDPAAFQGTGEGAPAQT